MNLDLDDELTAEQSRWSGRPDADFQILREGDGIDTGDANGYKIIVSDDGVEWTGQEAEFKESGEIARIEYYQFRTSDTGYIGWIEVESDYQGQGIALTIRTAAMDHLRQLGVSTVYTGQLSEGGKALASKQGFQPLQEGELAGQYYVYEF